jgi:FtsP/CotA-like multicopper oxidase with cupredoxin domain
MNASEISRRSFISGLTGAAGLLLTRSPVAAFHAADDAGLGGRADVTLRIAPVQIEIAKGRFVNTTGYNGAVPGPLIRFREGETATIEIFNDTPSAELVHWHGFEVPADIDGAEEQGSLSVPPHGRLSYRLTPRPSGTRYVHTHVMSMGDLNRGIFTGQFAFAYIEPKNNPGSYDQEIFLATHEWEPFLARTEEEEDSSPGHPMHKATHNEPKPHGWEAGYRHFTINGKSLGFGEPIRVREGQRILFHFLNASATDSARFALPGHRFEVVALDGNPVPRRQSVDVLELGAAERIDAVAVMENPGVWILGTPMDSHRAKGMGIVVEYANRSGKPRWVKPPASAWDYTLFGNSGPAPTPDEVIQMTIEQAGQTKQGFDQWQLNGKIYSATNPPRKLSKGRRYRLVFDNLTDDVHPVHLHRNSFELTKVYGKPTAGIMKDVILVKSYETAEVDVTPQMDGLALFHCHQQLHMDFGFKMLFDVV